LEVSFNPTHSHTALGVLFLFHNNHFLVDWLLHCWLLLLAAALTLNNHFLVDWLLHCWLLLLAAALTF
jgi:hypothetical protein